MARDPNTSGLIVVNDGSLLHICITCVYHRHFPEVRGEGRSLGEALRHLARLLSQGLDSVHGPRRKLLECAIAEVRAAYPKGAQRVRPALARHARPLPGKAIGARGHGR